MDDIFSDFSHSEPVSQQQQPGGLIDGLLDLNFDINDANQSQTQSTANINAPPISRTEAVRGFFDDEEKKR